MISRSKNMFCFVTIGAKCNDWWTQLVSSILTCINNGFQKHLKFWTKTALQSTVQLTYTDFSTMTTSTSNHVDSLFLFLLSTFINHNLQFWTVSTVSTFFQLADFWSSLAPTRWPRLLPALGVHMQPAHAHRVVRGVAGLAADFLIGVSRCR